jgi:hypothetical protein
MSFQASSYHPLMSCRQRGSGEEWEEMGIGEEWEATTDAGWVRVWEWGYI